MLANLFPQKYYKNSPLRIIKFKILQFFSLPQHVYTNKKQGKNEHKGNLKWGNKWNHQINIKVCVQAFAEEIRLTSCGMLLECVLGTQYYLNLRSFSTSATARPPSLPLKCDVPEILSICHLRCPVVSSMIHFWVAQNWIITNYNFLNSESMSFKKQLMMLNIVPFYMWKSVMRCLYQVLKSTQVLGQKKSSNYLEWIDAKRNRNNYLHVYLTFQPEGVKSLL